MVFGVLISSKCSDATNATRKWFNEPFSMLQTNLRQIDVDMDVNQTADAIVQQGATAWLTSVGGILANYPTELEFQYRNPGLTSRASGDLIQDSLDAAHARGLRLLARMDFSKVQLSVAEEHPDWLFISPNGTWQNHTNNVVSVCPSGRYYQERIFDILDEVISRYPLDGFFVNWAGMNERDYWRVYHGVCHCESCQSRWREISDEDLPNGPDDDNYPVWKTFSNAIVEEWTGRVSDFIAERLPDAGLILGTSADIRFHESNNAVGREFWPHHTSETVSSFVAYRPDVPILVNSAIFLDMIYRLASEEPANHAQYYIQTLSRGGNPSTYIMGPPGKVEWEGLEVAGQIMRFHRSWKQVYDGLRPVAKTGLVLPEETQSNFEESESEYRGLYSALQELHIPFDVVDVQYISAMSTSGQLNRYEVIVLPNLGGLDSNTTEALDAWAVDGGTLIATGAVGVEDSGELQLQALPADAQLEAITEEDELWSHYFAPPQERTEENYYNGPIIPIVGSYFKYTWKDDSEGVYELLDFGPFAPPEYQYGNVQVNERGIGIGKYGNGTGILFPFTVGRGYRETGLTSFRDFFALALREHGAKEQLHFNLAEQVEVTVNVNGPRTVVHLINLSGARHQNMGTHLPIPSGSITGPGNNISAYTLVANASLEVRDGEIILPQLDLFEVVVIDGLK